jgi:excisionase family DNA binding protein
VSTKSPWPQHEPGPLLKIPEVAARLACSIRTVRRLIGSGRLVPHRINRAVRVAERDLQAFLAQHRE